MNSPRFGARLVCALIAVAIAVSVQADTIKVFVMAGQSNMVGAGIVDELPTEPVDLSQPQEDVRYHYWIRTKVESVATEWIALQHLYQWTAPGSSYGSEITFGREVADAMPDENIAVIKVAANASSLCVSWDPDEGDERMLYQNLLGHVDFAVQQLIDDGHTPEIAGFVWVQGSGDARYPYSVYYEANLNDLIAHVRNDWGVPDLPVMFNQYHIDSDRPSVAELRRSQANVAAADPLAAMVNIDDMPLKSDNIHFQSVTQVELGRRLAVAYQQTIGRLVAGDFNDDGQVNRLDVHPFVLAVVDPAGYSLAYPQVDLGYIDPKIDGRVTLLDINPFVETLTAGEAQGQAVPEPAAILLLVAAASGMLARRP